VRPNISALWTDVGIGSCLRRGAGWTMDATCSAIDTRADRGELIDHLALRHMPALEQLELAEGSTTRILGLPVSVLRLVHGRCIELEADEPPDR
jgi:hypothetical protein